MELFEERVAHAVSYLHAHRADFVKEFGEFYGNYECDQVLNRSLEAFTSVGEAIFRLDPADWSFELLKDFAVNLEDVRSGSPTLVYLMIFETKDLGLAVYARSTREGGMRFIGHIDQYTKCALEHPNAKHSYVYDKALEISDEPPLFLVLARDPDEDAELCFVEHLETLVISMMDLCHSKDAPSLQIARGAQHPSLHSARKHEKLEGLNRLVPVKQNCRRTSETIECRNCGLSVDSRSYRSHLDEEGDLRSIHIYQICDDELKSAATLLNHVRTHDLGRPFVCPTCGKGFRTKMILDQHKRLHLENRGNVCDICGEILPTNDEWKMHVRAHNPNSVAHKCGTCGKELLTPSALANHELIHTGEKPHKCGHEGCPKSFREKSTLSAHELTHTDEKRFKCPAVGCLTAFRTNRDLSEHQVRCHSDERPYAYDVKGCKSIRYKYKGDLRKHAKKHKTCAHCNEVIVSTDRRTIDKHIKLCRTTAAFHANFDKRVVERDARELEAEERGKATKERKLDNDE